MRTLGNRDWQWPPLTNPVNIREWNHFCTSYSVARRHMRSVDVMMIKMMIIMMMMMMMMIRMMHNGVIEVDHVRPQEVANLEDYLPSEWFGPNLDGTKTKNKTNVRSS